MGVRTDDLDVAHRLHRAYDLRAVVDPDAGPDLSVVVHPPVGPGGVHPRPSLRHGGCDLVRTRSVDRQLRALDAFLGGLLDAPSDGLPVRGCAAVMRDGVTSLVPAGLLDRSSAAERMAARYGIRLADEVAIRLDAVRGDVVVVPGLAGDASLGIDDEFLAPAGRYRLAWVHWYADEVPVDERPALGLVRLLGRMPSQVADADLVLEGLASLAPRLVSPPVERAGPVDLDPVIAGLDA